MTVSMKQVQATIDGVLVVDVGKPTPRASEVLIEMTVTGVCGSDTHAAAGHHPFVPLPYLPGHEVVGIVREVGSSVSGIAVGQHVTVEPTLPCWACKMCLSERSNLCENLSFFGCGYEQGGMADFFTIDQKRLHIIPSGMSDLEASLIEPLATPVHAVRISGGVRDKVIVIIGAGTIGLLLLAAARHAGARRIVMTDRLQSKRARALRLGADAVVDADGTDVLATVRGELGESADVIFDCVAVQQTVDLSVQLALKAGTVVIVGVPAKSVTVALPQIQDQQVRIQGSATYMPEDFATAMQMIQAGKVTVADFITAQFPLTDAAAAFAASSGGEEVKVILVRSR